MNNDQYILRNKMTERYLYSTFDDIMWSFSIIVDIKNLDLAHIFNKIELEELKKNIPFNEKFNINEYVIILKDVEIRRLKLKNVNFINEMEDYIKTNF